MPIYEYECEDCGSIFEEIHKINKVPQYIKCKKCSGYAPKRMARSSFILKGDGWAKDGYQSKKCSGG